MIPLVISKPIRDKLRDKHHVQEEEVKECFYNHDGFYITDDREDHRTDPPTLWFIGETYRGRVLKIVFVHRDGNIYLKSAFEPKDGSDRIYAEIKQTQEK